MIVAWESGDEGCKGTQRFAQHRIVCFYIGAQGWKGHHTGDMGKDTNRRDILLRAREGGRYRKQEGGRYEIKGSIKGRRLVKEQKIKVKLERSQKEG